ATLYDEALDAERPHSWPDGFQVFREDWSGVASQFANHREHAEHLHGLWEPKYKPVAWRYRSFPADLAATPWDRWGPVGAGRPQRWPALTEPFRLGFTG